MQGRKKHIAVEKKERSGRRKEKNKARLCCAKLERNQKKNSRMNVNGIGAKEDVLRKKYILHTIYSIAYTWLLFPQSLQLLAIVFFIPRKIVPNVDF